MFELFENKDWVGEGLLNKLVGWFEFENKPGAGFCGVIVFTGWLLANKLGFGCYFWDCCGWLLKIILFVTGV